MPKTLFVTLTFDGVYEDTVAFLQPLLQEHNIPATFFAVTGTMGSRLEARQTCDIHALKALQDAGHEIGSHSVHHGLLRAPLRRELTQRLLHTKHTHSFQAILRKCTFARLKRIVQDIQRKRRTAVSHHAFKEDAQEAKRVLEFYLATPILSFAYPGGKVTPKSKEVLQQLGHTSARGTTTQINAHSTCDRYDLGSVLWTHETKHTDLQSLLDSAPDGSWLIETFHAITPEGGSDDDRYTVAQETFVAHIQALLQHPGVRFVTQQDQINAWYGTN